MERLKRKLIDLSGKGEIPLPTRLNLETSDGRLASL